jgi:TonB family protein
VIQLLHQPAQAERTQPQPVDLETAQPRPAPRPTTPPTPRPTPRPSPTAHPTPKPYRALRRPPRRSVNVAHQTSHPHGSPLQAPESSAPATLPGRENDTGESAVNPDPATVSAATAAPEPEPAATRPPACAQPNVAAATIDPVVPDTPPLAAEAGISGDVTVLVSLDEQSRVRDVRVVSSPSALLDAAALRAARASTFRTEVRDCRPIAADYAFIVEFTAQ